MTRVVSQLTSNFFLIESGLFRGVWSIETMMFRVVFVMVPEGFRGGSRWEWCFLAWNIFLEGKNIILLIYFFLFFRSGESIHPKHKVPASNPTGHEPTPGRTHPGYPPETIYSHELFFNENLVGKFWTLVESGGKFMRLLQGSQEGSIWYGKELQTDRMARKDLVWWSSYFILFFRII